MVSDVFIFLREYTPLHLAAKSGKTDTVEALIKHRANIHDKNKVSYMYMYIYE